MDARLSITRPSDLRHSEWTRLDNDRPRCPFCSTGMPDRFERRLEVFARAISRMGAAESTRPSDGLSGDPWYYRTHLHRQCKRVIEIRQRDPALAALKAAA